MKQKYPVIIMIIFASIFSYILFSYQGGQALENEEKTYLSQNVVTTNIDKKKTMSFAQEYDKLREVLVKYIDVKRHGGWPRIKYEGVLKKGDRNKYVAILRDRLKKEPQLDVSLEVEDETYFGDNLQQAVFNFQKRYGLILTGTAGPQTKEILNLPVQYLIDKIIINLKRLSSFNKELQEPYIMVNIPAFHLEFIKKGETILESKTIVGKPTRPTPVFSTKITSLVLNPRWYIPHSIAVEDFLPRIKNDISYLEENNMRVYKKTESGFIEKDPEKIEWENLNANNFDYYIWQDAGPKNFLGKVIFNSPNSLYIYLHDTPEKKLFKQRLRTFSSGCVRVEKALELANYLLDTNAKVSSEKANTILENGRETKIPLAESIPLHFVYLTAYINDNGHIQFRKDIYDREKIDERWDY